MAQGSIEEKAKRYDFLLKNMTSFFSEAEGLTLIQIESDYIVVKGYHNTLEEAIDEAIKQEAESADRT